MRNLSAGKKKIVNCIRSSPNGMSYEYRIAKELGIKRQSVHNQLLELLILGIIEYSTPPEIIKSGGGERIYYKLRR